MLDWIPQAFKGPVLAQLQDKERAWSRNRKQWFKGSFDFWKQGPGGYTHHQLQTVVPGLGGQSLFRSGGREATGYGEVDAGWLKGYQ